MSEIMRCIFDRHEPVRNVTALALMQYVCEEFPRSRTDGVPVGFRCLPPSPPCRIRSGGRTLLTPRSLTSRSSTYRLIACRESRYG